MTKVKDTKDILSVVDVDKRWIMPPAYLRIEEQELWHHLVGNSEPSAFTEREAPLLALYVRSLYLANHYSNNIGKNGDKGMNHKQWVENCRLAAALASRL